MLIALIILAVIATAGVVLYNRLVVARNRVDTAWSDIDVQLQRRHDLVPNLVKAVDAYAKYERATLDAVTELRAQALQSQAVAKLGEVEEQLASGINKLIALAESYPDLKASANFLKLQQDLSETEDFLQFARRYYNGSVRDYNIMIESVPSNIVAGLFRFTQREYFQKASDDVAKVPVVRLGQGE